MERNLMRMATNDVSDNGFGKLLGIKVDKVECERKFDEGNQGVW